MLSLRVNIKHGHKKFWNHLVLFEDNFEQDFMLFQQDLTSASRAGLNDVQMHLELVFQNEWN